MPRVLVLGSTGFIGNALSQSLVRSGEYRVWGVARSEEKALRLATQEIIPIVCEDPVKNGKAYLDVIRKEFIDVVVDCAGVYDGTLTILKDLKAVQEERLALSKKEGTFLPRLAFLYTSGMWVHGDSRGPVSETLPVGLSVSRTQPPKMVAGRAVWEREILAARDVLDVLIVRPGLLYGYDSPILNGILGPIIEAATSASPPASITVPVAPKAIMPMVHLDDIASGMHAAVEKLPLLSGTGVYPVFNIYGSYERASDMYEEFARALGYKGNVEFVAPPGDNLFLQAMSTTVNADTSRARQLLGWTSKKMPFVQGMDFYAKAFVAAQKGNAAQRQTVLPSVN